MDINELNRAYAEQYFKDHNLKERYQEAMKQKPLNMKEEALKLADNLRYIMQLNTTEQHQAIYHSEIMIRKLVAELDKQGKPVAWVCDAFHVDFEEQGWAVLLPQKEKERQIPLYTTPQTKPNAKERYDKCMEGENEPNPIERLRFFLSCALSGQDWIDVEPFIDAVTPQTKPLSDEEIVKIYQKVYESGVDNQIVALARAIEERHGIK